MVEHIFSIEVQIWTGSIVIQKTISNIKKNLKQDIMRKLKHLYCERRIEKVVLEDKEYYQEKSYHCSWKNRQSCVLFFAFFGQLGFHCEKWYAIADNMVYRHFVETEKFSIDTLIELTKTQKLKEIREFWEKTQLRQFNE